MKKILALVLALAVMMPALALADALSAFTDAYESGKRIELAVNAVIDEALAGAEASELVNSLTLSVTAQKEPEQIGLTLYGGEDTLVSLALEACEGKLCLRSNLMGEQGVLVSEEDIEPLMRRAIQYGVESGLLTQEDADEMLASMEAALAEESAAAEPSGEETLELTEEQQKQLDDALSSIDVTPALEEILALAAKVEITDRGIPHPGSDKAVMLIQGNFTGEDIRLLGQAVIKTLESSEGLVALLADAGFSIRDEGFRKTLDELLDQAAVAVKSLAFGVYLGEDGGVVHFSSMPIFELEGSEVTGSISYKRNTLEDSMRYSLDIGAGIRPAEGEYAVLFDAALTRETRADGSRYTFKMDDLELTATTFKTVQPLNGGEYSEWVLRGEMRLSGESVGTAQMQAGSFVSDPQAELPMTTQSLSLSLNGDAPCATLLIQTQALAENAASFAGEGAVEPMALSDEEFSAFMDGVLGSLMTWIVGMNELFPEMAE